MVAAEFGHTDTVIALAKAKADIDVKDNLVSLAGWMAVCAEVDHALGYVRWSQGGDVEGVLLQRQPCRCHFTNRDNTVWDGCDVVGERRQSSRYCLSARAGSG